MALKSLFFQSPILQFLWWRMCLGFASKLCSGGGHMMKQEWLIVDKCQSKDHTYMEVHSHNKKKPKKSWYNHWLTTTWRNAYYRMLKETNVLMSKFQKPKVKEEKGVRTKANLWVSWLFLSARIRLLSLSVTNEFRRRQVIQTTLRELGIKHQWRSPK